MLKLNLKNKFFILVMTLSPLICVFIEPPVSTAATLFAIIRLCVFTAGWILFVLRVCDTKKKIMVTLIYWSFFILSFLYMFLFVHFNFPSIALIFFLLLTSVLIFPFTLLSEILCGISPLGNKILNIEIAYIITLALMILFLVFMISRLKNIERKNVK